MWSQVNNHTKILLDVLFSDAYLLEIMTSTNEQAKLDPLTTIIESLDGDLYQPNGFLTGGYRK